MEYKQTDRGIEIEINSKLSLYDTFNCGQCFRFRKKEDSSFYGVAFNKELNLFREGQTLVLKNVSEEDYINIWKSYFDIDLDYNKVKDEIAVINPILKEACNYAPGIRVLRQEPWETLCSFIISQNNNIKRIEGIIERLCSKFGDRISEGVYSFPKPETLACLEPEDLKELRCGFRDKYIIDAARKVDSGEVNLKRVNELQIDDAREELMKIKGVGPKVADCALLYGFHKLEAFPQDVWIKKAMKVLFKDMSYKEFGKYAGIAQIYIFHYSRMNPQLFSEI